MFRLRIVAIIRELQYYKDRRPAYRMSVNGKYSHITSATSWSLVQRSPTNCGTSLCMIQKPQDWGGHGPRWVAAPQKKNAFLW